MWTVKNQKGDIMPLKLDYYYGKESEQYSFYRIPKLLFTDARFKDVSVEAKVLYGLLLDRMALSARNNWLDGEGRVYIIYTVAEVMETLGCAEQKANKLLTELDHIKGVGLIEKKRRGLGKPNIIYVKNFLDKAQDPGLRIQNDENHNSAETGFRYPKIKNCENHNSGNAIFRERESINSENRDLGYTQAVGCESLNCENHNSGNVKMEFQEMRKSQTNNTDIKNTDRNKTDPSIFRSKSDSVPTEPADCRYDGMDKMEAYRELIRENVDYDILLHDNPQWKDRLDEWIELMAEVCSSRKMTIRINREEMDTEIVRGRFLKLNGGHIRYVMDCLDRNTTMVGNIRAYVLSALFNSLTTISQYYSSLVSHDMACDFACG